jgi:NTP pyrophosphatase (non-canonical NTP hydrolase)
MAMEEMGECISAVNHISRQYNPTTLDHLAEEIADVRIMLEQLEQIYNLYSHVQVHRNEKLSRLQKRLS